MSKISFCWELGGGYGHLASFKPLADILVDRGHQVSAFLRDTQHASKFFDKNKLAFSSAPHYELKKPLSGPTISYADILKRCGYHSTQSVLRLVEKWREKYQHYGTELIIADHSPTALIAARTLNIPSTMFGTGFFAPPSVYPLPSITPWLDTDAEFLRKLEDDILEIINNILKHFAVKELEHLYQLFEVDENFLCTLPELDHYEGRAADAYWGPRYSDDTGVEAASISDAWQNESAKKVFVYTKDNYKFKHELLSSLKTIQADFLVHCANIEQADIKKYQADNVCFSVKPVQIKSIKNRADIVVCHSGHGTIAASLLLGIPLLVIPTQLEQALIGYKLNYFKFANMVEITDPSPDFAAKISQLLNNSEYKEQATKFSLFYGGFDQGQQLEEVALACEDLLGKQKYSRK